MSYQVDIRNSEHHTLVVVEGKWQVAVELHWTDGQFDGIGITDRMSNKAYWINGVQFGRTWDDVKDECATRLFPDGGLTTIVLGFIEFGPGC